MLYNNVTSNIKELLTKEEPFTTWVGLEAENVINNLIGLAIILAVVVCFCLLIIGGIKWITSGGDKEALISAQKTISAALIGIVIVFSVWAIKSLVEYFFGIEPPDLYEGHH